MSEDEFDDLAMLWRVEPDSTERRQIDRLARKARRQGWVMAYADLGMTILLVAGTVLAVFAARSPVLLVAALLIIAATIWLNWRRRAIRQMSPVLEALDRPGFLAMSVAIAETNRRRIRLALITFPIFVPAVVIFRAAARSDGEPADILNNILEWIMSARGISATAVLLVLMILVVRARQRNNSELRRLSDLRRSYEDEERKDAQGAG